MTFSVHGTTELRGGAAPAPRRGRSDTRSSARDRQAADDLSGAVSGLGRIEQLIDSSLINSFLHVED